MSPTPPVSNRLTRDCAALLKSRVALFEGTWEKYHKGTARVPGGPGWPGAQKDYLKNFSINIDNEIRYFLEEAKKAAQLVADNTRCIMTTRHCSTATPSTESPRFFSGEPIMPASLLQ